MIGYNRLVFGREEFRESEEHLEFQYRFLIVLMFNGIALSGLLLLAGQLGLYPHAGSHPYLLAGYLPLTAGLWLWLRGDKRRLYPAAWAFEILCVALYLAAYVLVPQDELRVLWFYANIPGVYVLLGKRGGVPVTVLTMLTLWVGNRFLAAPYSANAMVTMTISTLFIGVFFHVYTDRSISYFVRMRESNQLLYRQATRDALTGLMNARAYYEMGEQMIRLARRADIPYSILFIDLDYFKSVNDRFGHAVGDSVLKSVAGCLSANCRRSDIVGRIGGEEFSVFLPNADTASAARQAEALRQAIERQPHVIGAGRNVQVTASIGVAGSRFGSEVMHEIQRKADQAMYQAKSLGRNRVLLFEEAMPPGVSAPADAR